MHVGGGKGGRNENDTEGEVKEDIRGEEKIVQKARMMTRNVKEETLTFIILVSCTNSNNTKLRHFRWNKSENRVAWDDVDWRSFVVRRSAFDEVVTCFKNICFLCVCRWGENQVQRQLEYPLSYGVPVRERYGSTLLPATREQHDQNCTQSH